MEMNFDPKEKKREEKQIRRKRWYRTLCGMAAVVVMCTVYTLMLPALTLDNDTNNGSDLAGSASVENVSDSSSEASETGSSDSASSNDSSDSADSNTDGNNNESDSNDSSADSSDSSTAPSDADGSATSTDKDSSAADNNTNDPAQPSGSASDSDSDIVPSAGSNSEDGQITGSSDGDPDQITDEDSENGADQESGDSDTEEDSDTDENKSDDTADVETEADWIATLHDAISADNWDEMTWGEKLLAVAETQLGYTESILNFRVDGEGNHKGYTRYGAWRNDPYGDWCAMFVSFCLNYAGIEENETLIPYNDNCMAWVNKLKENKLYQDPDTYLPEAGDIVFFNVNGKGADHVGIVSDVEYGTKTVTRHVASNGSAIEDGVINMLSYVNDLQSEEGTSELETVEEEVTIAESIEVIEGNSSDKVQKVTYDLTEDNDVIGYVAIFRAEYVYNGGDISEFDNNENIDVPATFAASDTIYGSDEVGVGCTIKLTSAKTHSCSLHSESWSVESNSVEIDSFKGGTAIIKGKAVTDNVKVIHKYCTRDDEGHESEESKSIKVTQIDRAQVYYLNNPNGIPGSNNSEQWLPNVTYFVRNGNYAIGDYYDGNPSLVAKVDTTNATWDNNDKNILNPRPYIIEWPDGTTGESDGSWLMPKDLYEEQYIKIFEAYKDQLEEQLKNDTQLGNIQLNSVNDIEAIYLRPYKISKHNTYTTPDKHIDCVISVKCRDVYNVRFWVADLGTSDDYKIVDSKNYLTGNTIQEYNGDKAPAVVEKDGKTYYFDGWYNEAGAKIQSTGWPYNPSDTELNDGTVNFYAHYVPATVTYAVGTSSIGYGKVSAPGNIENYADRTYENLVQSGSFVEMTKGSIPKPNDGWVFEGWYTDAACTHSVSDEWVDSSTGKITPQKNTGDISNNGGWNDIIGKTYYAKFVSGVVLPETGGEGTALIYLLGVAIIAVSATAAVTKRRRKKMN